LGDATLDGYVDGSDHATWNANKGSNLAAWCKGDFNATGVINNDDHAIWFNNRFTSSFTAVVPEPGGVLLAILGLTTWLNFRNRKS
jgi:hypothetical protein